MRRPRLTIRLAMLLVAVVALAISGGRQVTRRYRDTVTSFEQKLLYHRTNAAFLRYTPEPGNSIWILPIPQPSQAELDHSRREAEYHEAMVLKYEQALRHPWHPVPPDPPKPR